MKNIPEKRRGNASVHTTAISQVVIGKSCFHEITHPPHSPDVACSDYYLFINLVVNKAICLK